MPQVNESMERVELWYQGEKTDRAPIRFSEHNARHNVDLSQVLAGYETIKDFWFDTEYQVDSFIENLKGSTVYGDTFPVFYPNLGPSVYASYYGVPLSYADVTSWAIHTVSDIDALDIDSLKIDRECENWKKIDELTDYALARCKDKFFVGYTDLHPSMDCAVDFTGVNEMCMSLIDNPDKVKEFLNKLCDDFSRFMIIIITGLKGCLRFPGWESRLREKCIFPAAIFRRCFLRRCLRNLCCRA